MTSIEFPTNHLLYFMDFTQLNSTKVTPYFLYPNFLFWFYSTLVYFHLIRIRQYNRKTILSLKRNKYQPQTKKKALLDKTKSHHFSFTTCFIICKFILVYYLLVYRSEPKQGIHVSSLTEYKFDGLEFLEFQNKSKISLNIFHYQL